MIKPVAALAFLLAFAAFAEAAEDKCIQSKWGSDAVTGITTALRQPRLDCADVGDGQHEKCSPRYVTIVGPWYCVRPDGSVYEWATPQ